MKENTPYVLGRGHLRGEGKGKHDRGCCLGHYLLTTKLGKGGKNRYSMQILFTFLFSSGLDSFIGLQSTDNRRIFEGGEESVVAFFLFYQESQSCRCTPFSSKRQMIKGSVHDRCERNY